MFKVLYSWVQPKSWIMQTRAFNVLPETIASVKLSKNTFSLVWRYIRIYFSFLNYSDATQDSLICAEQPGVQDKDVIVPHQCLLLFFKLGTKHPRLSTHQAVYTENIFFSFCWHFMSIKFPLKPSLLVFFFLFNSKNSQRGGDEKPCWAVHVQYGTTSACVPHRLTLQADSLPTALTNHHFFG